MTQEKFLLLHRKFFYFSYVFVLCRFNHDVDVNVPFSLKKVPAKKSPHTTLVAKKGIKHINRDEKKKLNIIRSFYFYVQSITTPTGEHDKHLQRKNQTFIGTCTVEFLEGNLVTFLSMF